jgi:hypothetical protein
MSGTTVPTVVCEDKAQSACSLAYLVENPARAVTEVSDEARGRD